MVNGHSKTLKAHDIAKDIFNIIFCFEKDVRMDSTPFFKSSMKILKMQHYGKEIIGAISQSHEVWSSIQLPFLQLIL